MFNKYILGHDFIDYIDDDCYIATKYYKCLTCGILIFENGYGDIFCCISNQYLNLTCEEYIIKNIIE